jgi:DNA polymerase III subunit epsilon
MRWLRPRPRLDETVRAYLDAPRPDMGAPWRDVPYAVVDVETTGLEPRRDALLAIGLVEIDAGRVLLERSWRTLVRPPEDAPLRPDAIAATGLLRADTAGAPPEAEVLPELLGRLRGRVLVVHVAEVDVAFLNRALQRHYGIRLRGPALDTARIAAAQQRDRRMLGDADAPTIRLRPLCENLGLPVYAEHDALGDALSTAQLFLAQASRLERSGGGTLGRLLRAGRALR